MTDTDSIVCKLESFAQNMLSVGCHFQDCLHNATATWRKKPKTMFMFQVVLCKVGRTNTNMGMKRLQRF